MIIRPGAHRLRQLLEGLDATSSLALPAALIAGSNGKGSVCALMESVLRLHGLKTGLYTSPHLCHVNERIRISGQPVSRLKLQSALERVEGASQIFLPDATLFEQLTAAAFLLFMDEKVDFVVCEVGLGGRFDSTNALQNLRVSCLTSVCLEHTDRLGKSEEKIAFDKSHIARLGQPFVISSTLSPEAKRGCDAAVSSIEPQSIWAVEDRLPIPYCDLFQEIKRDPCGFGLRPNFALSLQNVLLTLYALHALSHEYTFSLSLVEEGLKTAFWPGRFDIRFVPSLRSPILFDVAHNPGGVEYFLKQYQESSFAKSPYVLVTSALKDKEWQRIFLLLSQQASRVLVVPFEHEDRGLCFEELQSFIHAQSQNGTEHFWQVVPNLEAALQVVAQREDLVCVSGSVAFVGDVMTHLKIDPFAPLGWREDA